MKKRSASIAMLVMLAGLTLSAQAPAGWKQRLDRSTSASDPDAAGTVKFVTMGNGFHATSGSRAIYWRPGDVATGNYKVSATFTLTKPPGHAEAYGLIFAGKDLTGPNQNYMYFTLGGNGT